MEVMKPLFLLMGLSVLGMADAFNVRDVEKQYSVAPEVKVTKPLQQQLDFGFSNTTGNTDTLTLNGKYQLSFIQEGYAKRPLKLAFEASALMSKSDGVRDNESYRLWLGLEQRLQEAWLGYASLAWLHNTFQNFDAKESLGLGVGKSLISESHWSVTLKLGVAYNKEVYTNTQPTHTYSSLNEYFEVKREFNAISRLSLKLGALQNMAHFEEYELSSVIGMHFRVGENLSLTIEEEIDYLHIPPIGFKQTDTKSIIRLGYSF